jgi:hypothetical protein
MRRRVCADVLLTEDGSFCREFFVSREVDQAAAREHRRLASGARGRAASFKVERSAAPGNSD